MSAVAALVAGVLFGMGLVVSGMTEPGNVIAFLNLGPGWNVALMLVMGSALTVALIGYRLVGGRARPLFDDAFRAPTRRDIDTRLLVGAVLFGVGWGVSGYCPGPGIVGAFLLDERALIFLAGFAVGAIGFDLIDQRVQAPATADG